MIFAIAAYLAQSPPSPPSVVENVEPGARDVSIQLIARIPRLTARQVDALDVLVRDLPRDVEGYSHRDVLTVTSGERVQCLAGPDYVLVTMSTAPSNLRSGISLMEAIARNSRLTPPDKPTAPPAGAWTSALRPYVHGRPPRQGEVAALYRDLFRPDNLTLAVGGRLEPGSAATDWQTRMSAWVVPRALPPSRFEEAPAPLTKNPAGLDSLDLVGPVFGAGDAALPTRVLALFALGGGKAASLFRIARQTLMYSYRQEAFLYPVPQGWESRVLLVMKPVPDLAARADSLRKALLDDVAAWTDADRLRALAMADAVFNRDVDFSPFAFGPAGALGGTLEGRTFLRAYWQIKTGRPWDGAAFLTQMRDVRLDDLKQSAADFLTAAKPRLLPGG